MIYNKYYNIGRYSVVAIVIDEDIELAKIYQLQMSIKIKVDEYHSRILLKLNERNVLQMTKRNLSLQ